MIKWTKSTQILFYLVIDINQNLDQIKIQEILFSLNRNCNQTKIRRHTRTIENQIIKIKIKQNKNNRDNVC